MLSSDESSTEKLCEDVVQDSEKIVESSNERFAGVGYFSSTDDKSSPERSDGFIELKAKPESILR